MRVALIIGKYDALGGGAERWTDRHARALLDRGIRVAVIARSFRGLPEAAERFEVPASKGWNRRLRWGAKVEKLLERERFDIVHDMGDGWACDWFMPHHGSRQAGLAQNVVLLPKPLQPLQQMFHETLPRYREFAELERRQYDLSRETRYMAISRRVAEDMTQRHGVPTERIEVVYNGIDPTVFVPGRNDSLRRQLGWHDRTIFLLVAHNFRLKGLRETISALARLRRSHPRVGLIVAGNGRPLSYMQQARRLGIEGDVRFVGNVPDAVGLYQAADVYVQPTYYDPCSLVVLEALSCGLPTITTRINGASDLMPQGAGEVIAGPTHLDQLEASMTRFLDPSERKRASSAAREAMIRHHRNSSTERIVQLYRSERKNRSTVDRPAA